MICLFVEVFFYKPAAVGTCWKCLVKFNKSLKAAGMSANNVRKLNIGPRTEASRATLNAYYFFLIF